tara:strand:+ start:183 stop:1556 length:1374 start_codon:yes stop_codon:yes gene_type:complete
MKINQIKKYYEKYVNPGAKTMASFFSHGNDIFLKAKGSYIFTEKRKKILDITGGLGVLNLGHNHPEIIKERIKFQKNSNLEVHKNILSRHIAKLSKKISDVLPKDLTMSYFCNSGAEANEGAIKAAYKYHQGKRKTILHSDISFHGRLIASGSITPFLSKIKFPKSLNAKIFKHNDIEGIKKVIKTNLRKFGHPNIFSIIVEPYNHTKAIPCEYKFLKEIRKLCNKYKIILIYDEVYTGWSKTGTLFYFMRYRDICPDILTTSKSLGGGKASIAAYIMKREIFKKCYGTFQEHTLHSTTFNGFGEECITAMKSIDLLKKKKYCQSAKNIEKIVNKRFSLISKNYPQYNMTLRGCGAIQKIYLNNFNLVKNIVSYKLSKREKKLINLFKTRILEVAIIDELYHKYKIFSFYTLSTIVVSPSLIIKSKELNYFFDSFEKILKQGTENIITNYIKRLKND